MGYCTWTYLIPFLGTEAPYIISKVELSESSAGNEDRVRAAVIRQQCHHRSKHLAGKFYVSVTHLEATKTRPVMSDMENQQEACRMCRIETNRRTLTSNESESHTPGWYRVKELCTAESTSCLNSHNGALKCCESSMLAGTCSCEKSKEK